MNSWEYSQHIRQEPLRFMEFPYEIRAAMYSYFLCVPPLERFNLDQPFQQADSRGISTAIMLVSKQVYAEARRAFLRDTDFLIGTRIESPFVFQQVGMEVCGQIRKLALHMNDRPEPEVFLNSMFTHCHELRDVEFRLSPRAPVIPYIANFLRARSTFGDNQGPAITMEISIITQKLSRDTKLTKEITQASNERCSWNASLRKLKTIMVKGALDRREALQFDELNVNGWSFVQTKTQAIKDDTYRGFFVEREWKKL